MLPDRTILLDNEAVQALTDPGHRKRRRILAILEADHTRYRRSRVALSIGVPTSVRVEAGWDRRAGGTAHLSRIRVFDIPSTRLWPIRLPARGLTIPQSPTFTLPPPSWPRRRRM